MIFIKRSGKPNDAIWGTVMALFAVYTCGYLLWSHMGPSIITFLGIDSSSEETLSWDEIEREMSIYGDKKVLLKDISVLKGTASQLGYHSPIQWRVPIFDEKNPLHQWMKLSVEAEAKEQSHILAADSHKKITLNEELLKCIEVFFSEEIKAPEELSEEEQILFHLKIFHQYKATCIEHNGPYHK